MAELLRADDQKRENTRGNQRQSGKKPKLIFQLYANSNLQKELNINLLQYLMKSLHLSHTYINKSPGFSFLFFFFLIQKSCAGDHAPFLLIQVLNGIIRNGTVQVSKIKVRPQNFERTLQILRTCVALKWSPGFFYLWEGLLIDVPQNPDSDLFLQKGPIGLLHSSKGLSSCPPSIPGSLTSSELEIILSELWLHIYFLFFIFF